LKDELRELMKSDTLSAVNIPEALQYLLTDENIKNDIPQLKVFFFFFFFKNLKPMKLSIYSTLYFGKQFPL